METSDDPVTIGLVVAGGAIFQEEQRKSASKAAANARELAASRRTEAGVETKTATALEQQSEQKKLNKRRKASLLTRGFGQATVSRPTLGQTGLLGVN